MEGLLLLLFCSHCTSMSLHFTQTNIQLLHSTIQTSVVCTVQAFEYVR